MRPNSPCARSKSCFMLAISVVRAAAASSTACLFAFKLTVRLLQIIIDPLFGFAFRTPNRVSGATTYRVVTSHIFAAYLKACQEAGAGFGQSAFGEPNLLNHRTHKSTVLFIHGSSAKPSNRQSGASGATEVLDSDGSPSLARG